MQIQPSEWHAWTQEPCTKAFVLLLQASIQETQYRWSQQAYVDMDDASKSDRANLYALAGVDIMRQVIEMVQEKAPQLEGEE